MITQQTTELTASAVHIAESSAKECLKTAAVHGHAADNIVTWLAENDRRVAEARAQLESHRRDQAAFKAKAAGMRALAAVGRRELGMPPAPPEPAPEHTAQQPVEAAAHAALGHQGPSKSGEAGATARTAPDAPGLADALEAATVNGAGR